MVRRKHPMLHGTSTLQASAQFSDRKARDSGRNAPMARLQVEMRNLQPRILARPRANKNLFLISLIPRLSGTETTIPLSEFSNL